MKYSYLDLIAESTSKFRNSMAYSTLIALFSTVFFLLLLNNAHSLEKYYKVEGIVNDIKKDKIKVKSKARFNFKNVVNRDVILITINNNDYYVDNEYKKYWDNILNELLITEPITAH